MTRTGVSGPSIGRLVTPRHGDLRERADHHLEHVGLDSAQLASSMSLPTVIENVPLSPGNVASFQPADVTRDEPRHRSRRPLADQTVEAREVEDSGVRCARAVRARRSPGSHSAARLRRPLTRRPPGRLATTLRRPAGAVVALSFAGARGCRRDRRPTRGACARTPVTRGLWRHRRRCAAPRRRHQPLDVRALAHLDVRAPGAGDAVGSAHSKPRRQPSSTSSPSPRSLYKRGPEVEARRIDGERQLERAVRAQQLTGPREALASRT